MNNKKRDFKENYKNSDQTFLGSNGLKKKNDITNLFSEQSRTSWKRKQRLSLKAWPNFLRMATVKIFKLKAVTI